MDLDNRIRLDETPVDFSKSGVTGELHDDYPDAGKVSRFDQMRTYLIGLLSNQSCNEDTDGEPFEKRTGTLWFKKAAQIFSLFSGEEWDDILSKYVGIEYNGEVINVQDAINDIKSSMAYVAPRVTWSGIFITENHNIPVPEEYVAYLIDNMKALVYIEGLLIDPRLVRIVGTYIILSESVDYNIHDKFTVILEHITSSKEESVLA